MICDCKRKKNQEYIPQEVVELKKDDFFIKFSYEDLLVFYYQFKSITKGHIYLSNIQFLEMLNSFNVR
jgi:hypothetical protein